MTLHFSTVDEMSDRLTNTVIFYQDTPIWVASVAYGGSKSEGTIHYFPLPAKANRSGAVPTMTTRSDDPWLRAHDLHLGYVNPVKDMTNNAIYVTRTPVRKFKQGLCQENTKMGGLRFDTAIHTAEFANMLMNVYPTSLAVTKELRFHGPRSPVKAFSRHLALSLDEMEIYLLWYKGRKIASSHDAVEFAITSENYYLKELIERTGLLVKPQLYQAA